jgi:hypothetical protein
MTEVHAPGINRDHWFKLFKWQSPYFILLCLMPDDFTHQGESVATQWDKFPYFVRTIDTTEFADENYLL